MGFLSTLGVEQKIKECENEINTLETLIDNEIKDLEKESVTINNLNNIPKFFSNFALGEIQTVKYEYDGVIYNIINPPLISLEDFYKLIQEKNFNQHTDGFDARCLQLAEAYGRRLYYRDYNVSGKEKNTDIYKIKNLKSFIASASAFWNDQNWFKVDRKDKGNKELHAEAQQQVFQLMYNENQQGKPTVLQVDVKYKNGDIGRHYVLVVGVSENADGNNLKQEDFLILDPRDGDLQQLGDKRDIFAGYTNHNGDSAYWYRVLTLVDEEGILEYVNDQRRNAGFQPLKELPKEET